METILIVGMSILVAFLFFVVGIGLGIKIGMKRVLDALQIPDGYRISSIGYEKIK